MAAPLGRESIPLEEQMTPTKPERAALGIPKISLDGAPLSQVSTPGDDYDPTSHPASPFYSHPTTKTSFEQLKTCSTAGFSTYDSDLEAASKRPSHEEKSKRQSNRTSQKDCTVWPQRKTLMMQYKEKKRARTCYPWSRLSKKQKLIAKIVTLLLIVAIGVGIGVGVSRAVGGTWYKSSTQQGPVGVPNQGR